jgi:putative SOS response-associated peptidase YedK
MCGRFTLAKPPKAIQILFGLAEPPDILAPRYNVAPSQPVAVVRPAGGHREMTAIRWGLVPKWSKTKKPLYYARSETVAELPSWRSPFKKRRCLVPADGFYEWVEVPDGKQPYYFRRTDHSPFAIAGVWEDAPGEGCALLMTTPNELTAPIHDRHPVIIPAEHYALWLDPTTGVDRLAPLLAPPSPSGWEVYPVSRRVNSSRNEGPDLVEPVEPTKPAPSLFE